MSILFQLLLAMLPTLLEWLLKLLKKGAKAKGRELAQLDRVQWYVSQIAVTAPKVGASLSGAPPEEE